MTYLPDTNVWVRILRQPNSALAQRFYSRVPSEIVSCSIVLMELLHGCLRSANPIGNRAIVSALLEPFQCLPFENRAAEQFAIIRHFLQQNGNSIGPYDLQIAAIAITNQCILVTHNRDEFSRVPGLQMEDWEIT